MNAVVSGQAGVALLLEGKKLSSLHVDRPGQVIQRHPREVPFLFGGAKDFLILKDVDVEEVSRRLELASQEVDALHLALILLDGSLSDSTRKTAAEELGNLLGNEEIRHFVERVLYAQPLPHKADLPGARAACSGYVRLALGLLDKLEALQWEILEVRRAWEKLPDRLFESDLDRSYAESLAVREGFFLDLVDLRESETPMYGYLKGALRNAAFREIHNHSEILSTWISFFSPPRDLSSMWALLIGINSYPLFAPQGQLRGCVNDVQVMRQVLTEAFKFPEDHVTLLTDEQATRNGILAAMKRLLEHVGEDDVVVFHYSGNGSQMPDREGDEPDGLDETIVPSDSGRDPHPNRDITDDEIYLWLRELTAKTSWVTLILDCCHSGNIVRDSFGGEARFVEPDQRPLDQLPPSPLTAEARALLQNGRDGPSGYLPPGERYTLLAGCRSNERSFEIEEPAGVRHGALTYFLAQELRTLKSGATYRDVFEAAAPRVSSRFNDQHPQLEGARDREVFGIRSIKPMAFVPVLKRAGDRVLFGGGAVCDLREGARWAVYPAGTKVTQPREEPLGTVEITTVGAVTSQGKLLTESKPGAVIAGMKAVEEIHPFESRMPIEVEPDPERGRDVQALLEGLGRSKLVRPVAIGEVAQACIYLLKPRASVRAFSPVPMLGPLSEETWVVVGENGHLVMPAHRRSDPGVTSLIVDNLDRIARFRLTMRLKNERSKLAGKVKAELFRWVDGKPVKPEVGEGGEEIFHEQDRLVLRVVNQHEKPLFIYVLDLGLTGRIELVYPVSGSEGDPLIPYKPLDIGARDGEDLVLYMPEEFPFDRHAPSTETLEGIETLKIFATTHPIDDFYPLLQTGTREGKPVSGPVSSLDNLLSVTFGGGGYREFRNRTTGNGEEDWIALDQPFRLRRPTSSWPA